jgi:hypothetical protein
MKMIKVRCCKECPYILFEARSLQINPHTDPYIERNPYCFKSIKWKNEQRPGIKLIMKVPEVTYLEKHNLETIPDGCPLEDLKKMEE